jgi:hypothetical protein
MATGTTTTGSACIGMPGGAGTHYLTIDKGEINLRCGFRLQSLPTATDDYVFRYGISATNVSGGALGLTVSGTLGCSGIEVFRNASSEAEVRIVCCDFSTGTSLSTISNTGATLSTGVWYNFWIRLDSSNNSCRVYRCVYGGSYAQIGTTVTTNTPKTRTPSNYRGGMNFISGINKTAGTASVRAYLDYIGFDYTNQNRIVL